MPFPSRLPTRRVGWSRLPRTVLAAVLAVLTSLGLGLSTAAASHPAGIGPAGPLVRESPSSAAGTHLNGYYYSHWAFTGSSSGYWNVDQNMMIARRAPSTYWAQLWTWTGQTYGGYVGLQTNGIRGDGTTGDTAIFSLWNATTATGPRCGQFSGEGNGWSCRLAYPLTLHDTYRYRVWRLTADAGGQWWGAWIQNTATGVDTYLGQIQVPATDTLMSNVQNFVEYFGTKPGCASVPKSIATWTRPAANSNGSSGYAYSSRYTATATDQGSCTNGSATPVTTGSSPGVRVVLGG